MAASGTPRLFTSSAIRRLTCVIIGCDQAPTAAQGHPGPTELLSAQVERSPPGKGGDLQAGAHQAVPACLPFCADGQRHGFCGLQAWPTASAGGVDRARHQLRGASDPVPPLYLAATLRNQSPDMHGMPAAPASPDTARLQIRRQLPGKASPVLRTAMVMEARRRSGPTPTAAPLPVLGR